jgi:hypothetical protein
MPGLHVLERDVVDGLAVGERVPDLLQQRAAGAGDVEGLER